MRRRRKGYFERAETDPVPLRASVTRRVAFCEVDPVAVAWHGRYPEYFEEAAAELRRTCGLSYADFRDADLRAPIVQLHVDYHRPLHLDDEITITATLVWTEAARLNTEYEILKSDGSTAATGFTVQMFTDAATGEPCLIPPPLLQICHTRWREGVLKCLQQDR